MRKVPLKAIGLCLAATLTTSAMADNEQVELSNQPLFITSTADPNILFILDDSGSMRWGFIPDGQINDIFADEPRFTDTANNVSGAVCGESLQWYGGYRVCFMDIDGKEFAASHEQNPMYYSPDITYEPPLRGDGSRYPDASFTDAWVDGYNPDSSETIDLSSDYRAYMDEYFWVCRNRTGSGQCATERGGFTLSQGGDAEDAFYYEFDSSCDSDDLSRDCYTRRSVSSDERQNFANWYSYFRNRLLAARAGITAAFIDQPEAMRVGYGAINVDGAVERGVRPFEGEERQEFFDWLHSTDAPGGTPLRVALRGAGEYFEDSSDTGPWADDPGVSDGQHVSEFAECRQSFTVLMTDGYYNDSSSDVGVGNVDGSTGEVIRGPGGERYQYEPQAPFSDEHSDTLADVAMHFWNRDLQPDMENRVPTTEDNPAFWQHMVTFGVGLGVTGNIENPDAAFDAIRTGEEIDWPDPQLGDEEKIDDMLHAGVNSRGGFFSVDDPDTFASQLSGVLGQISEAVGSSTGVTFDTATLEEDSLIFAARFDSGRWRGDLDARPLISEEEGGVLQNPEIGPPVWSAADTLDGRDLNGDPRTIITSDGELGIPFQWDEDILSERQIADLRFGGGTSDERDERAEQRVGWLRGERGNEGGADGFRVRDSRLGDIVNSTPVRVARPASAWPDSERFGETENRYSDFRARQMDRTPVIYSGANDGMLHGFKATEDGGEELLAFMPSAIFSDQPARGLHHLTSSGYSHRYYVDLPPLVSDAFIRGRNSEGEATGSADWRTVLMGGSRFGERAIFALDVTDPDRFSEDNAAELMLWEFTVADDERMGFITEAPIIALAEWGNNDYRWTAFFGNGYNADDPATGFFMLDLEGGLDGEWSEGSDYEFVSFRDSADPAGMSALAVYDQSGNGVVDRVYGGDLNGNLWVAESSGNQGFRSPYRQGQTPSPLFVARDDAGDRQPITGSPLIIPNANIQPEGGAPDLYVFFGTGRYFNEADLGDTQQQSLYAVRDIGSSELDRDILARRDLREENDFQGSGVDVLLSDEGDSQVGADYGWYVDLVGTGERIELAPQVRGEILFVNSSIPSDNPCVAGGSSRTMAFTLSGLTPEWPVFDEFDEPVVSFKLDDGIPSQSAFLGDYRFTPTSVGDVVVERVDTGHSDDAMGRQGWQEMIE